jgi:hypothetical protein
VEHQLSRVLVVVGEVIVEVVVPLVVVALRVRTLAMAIMHPLTLLVVVVELRTTFQVAVLVAMVAQASSM